MKGLEVSKLVKKIVIIVCIAITCMLIGYFIGVFTKNSKTVQTVSTEQVPTIVNETPQINYSETIAIVNLDEGLTVGEKTMNYGNSLISTLESNVRVTGLQDARNGIECGEYCAYIVIPTTLSENVMTINEKPVISEMTYAIAPGLEGKDRDKAICNVYSIYNSFSNSVTQVYTATILDEYHTAQDSANTIMANDTKDMNALLEIQGYNLVEITTIPELIKVENKVTELVLDDYYGTYTSLVGDINNTYTEAYKKAQSGLNEVTTMAEIISTSVKSWEDITINMTDILTKYDEYVKENDITLEKLERDDKLEVEAYDKWLEEVSIDIDRYNTIIFDYNALLDDKLNKYKYVESSYKDILEDMTPVLDDKDLCVIELEGTKIDACEYIYKFYSEEEFEEYTNHVDTAVENVYMRLVDEYNKIENEVARPSGQTILAGYSSAEEYVLDMLKEELYENPTNTPEAPTETVAPTESEETTECESGESSDVEEIETEEISQASEEMLEKITEETVTNETPTETEVIEPLEEILLGMRAGIEPIRFNMVVFNDEIGEPNIKIGEKTYNRIPQLKKEEIEEAFKLFVDSVKETSTKKSENIIFMLDNNEMMQEEYLAAIKYYDDLKIDIESLGIKAEAVILKADENRINSYVSQMGSNTQRIKSTVSTHETKYKTYANDVYTATEKNISTLKENIHQSQQLSAQKVSDGLEAAKKSRVTNNETNISLLNTLTGRLPYTRLGNVENKEVYTFMAKPISLFDASEPIEIAEQQEVVKQITTVTTTLDEGNNVDINTICIIIGFIVLLIVSGIVSVVIGVRKTTEDF